MQVVVSAVLTTAFESFENHEMGQFDAKLMNPHLNNGIIEKESCLKIKLSKPVGSQTQENFQEGSRDMQPFEKNSNQRLRRSKNSQCNPITGMCNGH